MTITYETKNIDQSEVNDLINDAGDDYVHVNPNADEYEDTIVDRIIRRRQTMNQNNKDNEDEEYEQPHHPENDIPITNEEQQEMMDEMAKELEDLEEY